MLLRHPMLIFNFTGKKIPALHSLASKTFRKQKSQPAIMFDGFLPASKVKKNKNYAIPASVKRNSVFASQR